MLRPRSRPSSLQVARSCSPSTLMSTKCMPIFETLRATFLASINKQAWQKSRHSFLPTTDKGKGNNGKRTALTGVRTSLRTPLGNGISDSTARIETPDGMQVTLYQVGIPEEQQ